MRIGNIAIGAEYRINEQFQNFLNFWVGKFWKIVNFPIWKIAKISNLENSENF